MTIFNNFFATCPKNLEGLLEKELCDLGAVATKQTVAGVSFSGDLSLAYRVCLWSRLANRILLPLTTFAVPHANALYRGISQINWQEHLAVDGSFIVDFVGVTPGLKNSHFNALKVKDAIVDQMRAKGGQRPSIIKDNPDLRINVHLDCEIATVSIDFSGDSLHRRGCRTTPGAAPLKENLAAAILYRSNWPAFATQNKPLFDPMCGSGTILLEAALMAQDCAPGLLRKTFGFEKWLKHDRSLWQSLVAEAQVRHKKGAEQFKGMICGCDIDSKVVRIAQKHIENAGLERMVRVSVGKMEQATPERYNFTQSGIIVTNPPYGERLHTASPIADLYRDFGEVLRHHFLHWEVAMLTGNPELGKTMKLRAVKQYQFFNGTLPCKLLLFRVTPEMFWQEYRGEKYK